MKLIIAIIQPQKLESVKSELSSVDVVRLTIVDCQGFGRHQVDDGKTATSATADSTSAADPWINMHRKVQLQIAVNEEFVEPTIKAIVRAGKTGDDGESGDGKIFVLPLDDCIRIRTGERGEEAI